MHFTRTSNGKYSVSPARDFTIEFDITHEGILNPTIEYREVLVKWLIQQGADDCNWLYRAAQSVIESYIADIPLGYVAVKAFGVDIWVEIDVWKTKGPGAKENPYSGGGRTKFTHNYVEVPENYTGFAHLYSTFAEFSIVEMTIEEAAWFNLKPLNNVLNGAELSAEMPKGGFNKEKSYLFLRNYLF